MIQNRAADVMQNCASDVIGNASADSAQCSIPGNALLASTLYNQVYESTSDVYSKAHAFCTRRCVASIAPSNFPSFSNCIYSSYSNFCGFVCDFVSRMFFRPINNLTTSFSDFSRTTWSVVGNLSGEIMDITYGRARSWCLWLFDGNWMRTASSRLEQCVNYYCPTASTQILSSSFGNLTRCIHSAWSTTSSVLHWPITTINNLVLIIQEAYRTLSTLLYWPIDASATYGGLTRIGHQFCTLIVSVVSWPLNTATIVCASTKQAFQWLCSLLLLGLFPPPGPANT